ncbi:MAG: J domain-containing protein [Devosia sp.]|jgi:DnaJ-domain-containing protein 1|uniref:J domain-containing protein n=1 Tax=Devosia sp. TaxID=1871048 RepID=UPI0037C0034D
MKLDSKLFDAIRIKGRNAEKPREATPRCAWEGCEEPGEYRAPKANHKEGEYHNFCLEHVKHYNHAFNFFAGMSPGEMEERLSRWSQTDGRPSWGFGAKANSAGPRMPRREARDPSKRFQDPLHIFARYARAQQRGPAPERAVPLHENDRQALETLGIKGRVPSDEIKQAYKRLVKVHHPDANGGNKASEERLRAIIAAYAHLKTKGFVTR